MINTEPTSYRMLNKRRNRNRFCILTFSFLLLTFFTGCVPLPKAPPAPAKVYLEVPAKDYKPQGKELVVTFIDVGQGDSEFIRTPNGKNILIDAGGTPSWSKSSFEPGEEVVVPFLESQKVKRLDFVIATHSDGDHVGGLPAVIRKFPITILYENGANTASPENEKMHETIKEKNVATAVAKQGDVIDADPSVKLDVLSPPRNFYFEAENNNAVAVRLTYGSVSFLFTADMEFEAEDSMLKTYGDKIRSNILKVGHHGSASSTSAEFLKAVDPEIAVISVGARNNFGHPYSGVIAKLQDADADIYRTDEDGSVTVRTDGRKFTVESEKNPLTK